jgi:hypothetical protein
MNESLDGLIRWALHDGVHGAEPSPQAWERIQTRIRDGADSAVARPRKRQNPLSRRSWLGWLVGAGADFPVPGDPRAAWQRQMLAADMGMSLSIVRIIEGRMPILRLVA